MRQLLISTCLLVFMLLPFQSVADTIILKSGKTIQASDCWEEGDLVKCKLYGQIVGYSKSDIAEYRIAPRPIKLITGFRFDIWQSGITIREAIKIAEINNKPFHRSGLLSVNKVFNAKMCRPYANTAIEFYYKDQIFGRLATLNFNFTPTGKRLYSLDVAFSGPRISKNSEFRKQIEALLKEKYGVPVKNSDHIVYKNYDWKINNNATVTMRLGGNNVHVIYTDAKLSKMAENEKLKLVQNKFKKNDKDKF